MTRQPCTALLIAWFAGTALAQEAGDDELAKSVAAMRAAKGDDVAKAWFAIKDLATTATHLSAAARTDALAAGLELDWTMQIFVMRALSKAPDSLRASHHLFVACQAQDIREQNFASQRRPEFDHDRARILGFQSLDGGEGWKAMDDLLGIQARPVRKELLAACKAHRHPETAKGLTLLVRRLAHDPECEPLFEELLEHPPIDSIDGVMAVVEACCSRHQELRTAVEDAKKWQHRTKPPGPSKSEWQRSEEETKRRLIALEQRRFDKFERSFDEKAERLGRYAQVWKAPAPPCTGMPFKPWQYWCEAVRKSLVKRTEDKD